MHLEVVGMPGSFTSKSAIFLVLLLSQLPAAASAQTQTAIIRATACNETGDPIEGVTMTLKSGEAIIGTLQTDNNGIAEFHTGPGSYSVVASKVGFEVFAASNLTLAALPLEVKFSLIPKIEVKDSVTVNASESSPVEEMSAKAVVLEPAEVKNLPGLPSTVKDVLPLIPGVTRSPEGSINISGRNEQHSAMIVNSTDVTDPATGQFGVTVPVDSVETINVFQTPYVAQYGRFTSGVVAVETKRGGNKWNFDLNDPFPEFRIRSLHLRGLKTATPRLNFDGPLIRDRFYLSEGVEYVLAKKEVKTLPFPDNQTRAESVNSFTQLDYVLSPMHTLTGTVHVTPRRLDHANLDFFNPRHVTPNFRAWDYTGTIIDRSTLGHSVLESVIAVRRFRTDIFSQGSEDMTFTPMGNVGNYFGRQNREGWRVEWTELYSPQPQHAGGVHNLKFGTSVMRTTATGQFFSNPVNVRDSTGSLLERIDFTASSPFDKSDSDVAWFSQDHWILNPVVGMDLGVRFERQGITGTFRVAPRFGFVWTPFGFDRTVIRGGWGLFYDHVPLGVYSFQSKPSQVITSYDPDGDIIEGPTLIPNILGYAQSHFPFIHRRQIPGNFAPYSAMWNVGIEHPVSHTLKVRVDYMQNSADGVLTVQPETVHGTGAFVLSGDGRSRYRQLEITARWAVQKGEQILFSYVHSQTYGDLNESDNYTGDYPLALMRPRFRSRLSGDIPNRFLAWGQIHLPWRMRIAPTVEYRNGFPYSVFNARQDYWGAPNQYRYPNFFSLDACFSKDVNLTSKHAVRLSWSWFNLTNHFNPTIVHANMADPQYGYFFGARKRRSIIDFDVLF